MNYKYYSVIKRLEEGAYPEKKGIKKIKNFDQLTFCEEIGRRAWGYIEYDKPLNHYDMINYDLIAVKLKTLHLNYLGKDSWGRYVYKDENGKLWKHTDCCSPRECCEERGDVLFSSLNNAFDGEPDCFMSEHIRVKYLNENMK